MTKKEGLLLVSMMKRSLLFEEHCVFLIKTLSKRIAVSDASASTEESRTALQNFDRTMQDGLARLESAHERSGMVLEEMVNSCGNLPEE